MPIILPDILAVDPPHDGAVYCLGAFDGVHRGHLHLFDLVGKIRGETGLPAWALVLYRDPANPLFAGRQAITTIDERNQILGETTLDGAGTLTLSPSLTNMAHEAFVRELLIGKLKARHLVVGWDFHYGHSRVGNVTLLQEQCAAAGVTVTVVSPVMDGAEPIKSTTIRHYLTAGELDKANAWLTRPFFAMGSVVEGRREGRKLGYPTANLALPDEKLRPAFGVYATIAEVPAGRFYAATNVGIRPTYGASGPPSVEAHLLNFSGDLYGQPMTLHFLTYLRPERRFEGVAALREQLEKDVAAVGEFLSEPRA